MTEPELKLQKVKETAVKREFRASDFLTDEQMEEVHRSNARGKKKAGFDDIDAYVAEILARFGYQAYLAWKCGDISAENMAKFIQAERAREVRYRLGLENIIVASVAGANNPTKGGHAPKSLKTAIKMLKREENIAKGVQ